MAPQQPRLLPANALEANLARAKKQTKARSAGKVKLLRASLFEVKK
jgi:hypothetical protein